MKFPILVLCHLLSTGEAINDMYKQTGSQVDKSLRTKKPIRQHGNAIVKSFKDGDEVSFKLSSRDDARVVVASDNEDLDYSIAQPGKGSFFKKIEKLLEEGHPGARGKEKVNDKEVDARAVKLKVPQGGELKVKAEVKTKNKGKGKGPRSLAESAAVAILNPGSALNVCYEPLDLINYVGEPVSLKVALCETDNGFVHGDGGDGIVSGTATTSVADVGGDDGAFSIPPSGKDGWSVVSFTPNTAGLYSIAIDVEASADGESFERQVHGVVAVSEKQLDSVDSASLGMVGDSAHLVLKVALADGYSPSEEAEPFIVSADIVDEAGRDVVTASALADLESDNTLQVVIQPEWFEDLASSVYSIEYLRISNSDGTVPLIIAEDIPIETTTDIFVRNRRLSEMPQERESRMTQGVRPPQDQDAGPGGLRRQLQGSKTIATHGYCSGGVWQGYTNGAVYYFQDYNKNRSNSYFAYLLDNFAISIGASYWSGVGCGIIAHSQGGMAALHMYSYRWTCLDNISSGRMIQSVGTPYRGSALAGAAAALGDVFGAGCGTNYDLTYEGASNWLWGIPSWARSKVYYHTTSPTDKWWWYDYCNVVTDALLSDPNDGATEKWSGQLSGGHNRGHKEGWCHTAGMRDTAQTRDWGRNNEMLANAAT